MSLTLERLDTLLNGSLTSDDGERYFDFSWEEGSDVLDYARERAAREACEAALPEGWCIDLQGHPGEWQAQAWNFDGGVSKGCVSGGWYLTPTGAYLALLAALQERAK